MRNKFKPTLLFPEYFDICLSFLYSKISPTQKKNRIIAYNGRKFSSLKFRPAFVKRPVRSFLRSRIPGNRIRTFFKKKKKKQKIKKK